MKKVRQLLDSIQPPDPKISEDAREFWSQARQNFIQLGQIEKICTKLASIQGKVFPTIQERKLFILGADHGISDEGVSPSLAPTTQQILDDIANGKALINSLSKSPNFDIIPVNMGCFKTPESEKVLNFSIGKGTANFHNENAMDEKQMLKAIKSGIKLFDQEVGNPEGTLIALGDVGRGNTTTCAAILSALTDCDPALVVDQGSGVDKKGLSHKQEVVNNALDARNIYENDSFDSLMKVGGFEILGMVGLLIRAAEKRVPVLLDGFAPTTAAYVSTRLSSHMRHYFIPTHRGGEKGHQFILKLLDLNPYLFFDFRQGEGVGAAMCFGLIENALNLLGYVHQKLSQNVARNKAAAAKPVGKTLGTLVSKVSKLSTVSTSTKFPQTPSRPLKK